MSVPVISEDSGLPPESLAAHPPHPQPRCHPMRHFQTLKQSWTQSTPLIWGLELKTPSL